MAALNITGLLTPTVVALDGLAVTLGDLRISLLTVVKGVVAFAVLLWAAALLSRVLETRIEKAPYLTPSVWVLLGKLTKITLLSIAASAGRRNAAIRRVSRPHDPLVSAPPVSAFSVCRMTNTKTSPSCVASTNS